MTKALAQYTITDFNDVNISNTPPTSPIINSLWLDSSIVPNQLKRYDGTKWVVVNDTQEKFNTIENRVDVVEQKTTNTAIISTVRSSTEYINDQGQKVSKGSIISEINQSAETIKISASKINIEGAVTFSSFDASTQTKVNNGDTAKTTLDTNKAIWDGKSKTFIATPTIPYYAGDIWKNGTTTYICAITRVSGVYTASDWIKTGDVTSANTSADTSKVNGVAASTVTTNAQNGATAYGDTSRWKVTGKTTINGGQIEADTITAIQIAAKSIDVEHINSLNGLNINNQFIVDSVGNVSFKGNLNGASGTFNGSLSVQNGAASVDISNGAITQRFQDTVGTKETVLKEGSATFTFNQAGAITSSAIGGYSGGLNITSDGGVYFQPLQGVYFYTNNGYGAYLDGKKLISEGTIGSYLTSYALKSSPTFTGTANFTGNVDTNKLRGYTSSDQIGIGGGNCRIDTSLNTFRLFTSVTGASDYGIKVIDGGGLQMVVSSAIKLNVDSSGKLNAYGGYENLGRTPAFTWTGTIQVNNSVFINHNLGYNPMIKLSGTVGNVVITSADQTVNQIRIYCYGNAWTGTIYFY